MIRTRCEPAKDGQAGLTFVELLISVVLLTLITGALSAAFVTSMRASSGSSQRANESNDAQLIAGFLVRDAQAAGGTDPVTGLIDSTLGVTTPTPGPFSNGCAYPGDGVIGFKWIDRSTAAPSTHVANYSYVPVDTTFQGIRYKAHELVRTTCVDSGAAAGLALGRKVVTTPSPKQSPFGWCNSDENAACPAFPNTVSLRITESNAPLNSNTPYQFVLSASVRPSSDVPTQLNPGNAASVPFLALGGGTCNGSSAASGLNQAGSSTLRVYGGVGINATDAPGCPAVLFNGAAHTYTAAGLPQQGSYGDPYASLPTPPGTCPVSGGSNPNPVGGVYPAGLYPQPLPSGAALGPGVFVLCASAPSGLHGDGVMLYLAKGAVNWSGGNTVLTASSSGPYAGIAIWQPSSNTNPFVVSGNAGFNLNPATPALTPPLGSVLYAPGAEVDLSGTADLVLGGLIAKTILVTGNHSVTVGVPPATLPTITSPASLPVGLIGHPYPSTPFTATGGSGVNKWSGTNLDGLTIDANTGVLSGTPTLAGNFAATITVTDSLGDVYLKSYTLTIAPLPTATSLSPSSLGQGATSRPVTITGTGFQNGATVSFSGTGVTAVNPVTFVNSTTLTATVTVAGNAATGLRTVTITNPDTGAVTKNFTVNPKPTVTSASPLAQGATSRPVTITGTGFVNGATVAISGSGVTIVNPVTFVNSTTLTATVTLTPGATLGARDVTVTNPDFGVNTGPNVFTVNPNPTISLINPSTHPKGGGAFNITITGTNFVAGTPLAVTFSGTRITVNSTTFVNSTTITVNVTIAGNAAQTGRNVTLTNGDYGTFTVVNGFTVT